MAKKMGIKQLKQKKKDVGLTRREEDKLLRKIKIRKGKKQSARNEKFELMKDRARDLYFVVKYADNGEVLHQYNIADIHRKLIDEFEEEFNRSTVYFWAKDAEQDGTSWQTKFDLVIKEGLTLEDLKQMGIDGDATPESLVDRILVARIAETHQSDMKIERTSARGLELYTAIVERKLLTINAMVLTIQDEVSRKIKPEDMTYTPDMLPKLTSQEMKVYQEINATARGRVDKRREHVLGDTAGDQSLKDLLAMD